MMEVAVKLQSTVWRPNALHELTGRWKEVIPTALQWEDVRLRDLTSAIQEDASLSYSEDRLFIVG